MPIVAIIFGIPLILLGVLGYVFSGSQHPTALIPALVGCIFIVLGQVGRGVARLRKHMMHAAAAVGLLGFLAAAGRLIAIFASGNSPAPLGIFCLSGMAILCLLFVLLCVRSFIHARKNRIAQNV